MYFKHVPMVSLLSFTFLYILSPAHATGREGHEWAAAPRSAGRSPRQRRTPRIAPGFTVVFACTRGQRGEADGANAAQPRQGRIYASTRRSQAGRLGTVPVARAEREKVGIYGPCWDIILRTSRSHQKVLSSEVS